MFPDIIRVPKNAGGLWVGIGCGLPLEQYSQVYSPWEEQALGGRLAAMS
jgi:hypothetical protein